MSNTQKKNLQELREQIDRIDGQLVALLEERMDVVAGVIAYKLEHHQPIFDSRREQEKLDRLSEQARPETVGYMRKMLQGIMDVSKEYQQAVAVDDAHMFFEHGAVDDAHMFFEHGAVDDAHMFFEHGAVPQYGLLGRKLGHSFSPMLHKEFGGYDYALFEYEEEKVPEFLLHGSYKAINVTIPYKKTVIPYLSEMSDIAKRTDSVNVILRREDGTLYGDNSDYYGLKFSMERRGFSVDGKKVLILGNGGVASTVRVLMQDMKAAQCITVSRSGEDNYENLSRHYDAQIIINTTPVGMYMYPEQGAVISLKPFYQCEGVIDLIFNPLQTKLLLEARERNIPFMNGLDMLVAQAARACESFIDTKISPERIGQVCDDMERKCQNIILIGMPGCGKTSVGAELAEQLKRPFWDVDQEIAKAQGKTPGEIIRQRGEAAFREIEAAVLKQLTSQTGTVISCGGGIVTREENLDWIRQNGIAVYVQRNLAALDTADRPLSQQKSVAVLYEERKALYEKFADISVENEGSVAETAACILKQLGY